MNLSQTYSGLIADPELGQKGTNSAKLESTSIGAEGGDNASLLDSTEAAVWWSCVVTFWLDSRGLGASFSHAVSAERTKSQLLESQIFQGRRYLKNNCWEGRVGPRQFRTKQGGAGTGKFTAETRTETKSQVCSPNA